MEFLIGIVTSVVEKIGEHTVAPVFHQFDYFFNYKKNISNLESQIKKLQGEMEKLQVLVTKAEKKGDEIAKYVRDWQKKTSEIIKKSEKFIKEEGRANTSCFGYGAFPNLILRRRLSRKAEKMAQVAWNEIEEGQKINQNEAAISYHGILPTFFENTKSQESFESRISTLKEIMDALRDPNVSRIGVYGMPGVGKTTLAKEVEQEVLKERLFDVVVMVPISQTPNFFEIQQIIAEKLGLELREKVVPTRAERLKDQLMKQEKKILIVLDDVWAKLELHEVGVIEKGIKMLLTSRLQRVCVQMDTNNNFQVGILKEDEALVLFNRINGDTAKGEDLQDLVTMIVKECAGLPLAITTVASALKGKGRAAWEDVLRELSRSSAEDIDGMGKVHSSVKKSYYYLDGDNMRSLLVFCSLHKDDAEIHIDQLLRYGSGLGLFQGITKLEEARNKVFNLVENLKAASLLLGGRSPLFVKLHDVVRDAVLSIAAKDERMYLVEDVLQLRHDGSRFKDSHAISLFYNNVDGLSTILACPQLKLFFLFGSGSSAQMTSNLIIQETSELTVLHLTSVHIEGLRSCFPVLENLQTLCLNDCQLGDIASIGGLKHLKVLDLARSKIKELPKEFKQLTSLKLLDLSYCDQLKVIQPNVLSSLTNLEELNMRASFTSWEANKDDGDRSNASLLELSNLLKLSALHIQVKNSNVLPRNKWLSDKMERYCIEIEPSLYFLSTRRDGVSRILDVHLDHCCQLDEYKIRALLKASDYLRLEGLVGIHDVVRGLDTDGFPQLKHLMFGFNDDIRYIVNLTDDDYASVFPKLESLSLHQLGNLENICHGELVAESFSKLKAVWVSDCKKLKNLLPFSIARRLETIHLSSCTLMEEIVACGGKDDAGENNNNNEVVDGQIEFPQLRSLYLVHLPELKQFCSGSKMPSTWQKTKEPTITDTTSIPLFNQKIGFPNLESMEISLINSKKIWDYPSTTSCSFHKLASLHIMGCHNLKNILSSRMLVRVVPNLTIMEIRECEMVEEVFEIERSCVEETDDVITTQLRILNLDLLPKLKHVWNKDPQGTLVFQNLKEVRVRLCRNLESLFPASVAKSLLQLETLSISWSDLLKEIVVSSKDEEGTTLETVPTLVFPKLTSLYLGFLPQLMSFYAGKCTKQTINDPIQQPQFFIEKVEFPSLRSIQKFAGSSKLKKILPSSSLTRLAPNLTELSIEYCDMLEDIFDGIERSSSVEETSNVKASQLSSLSLSSLPKLKHVWNKDPQGTLVFQNLQQIDISYCPNLESVFPPSVAKGLFQLKTLVIQNCELLREIVAKREAGTKTETYMPQFVFPKLKSLRLDKLPELVRFYPGLHTSAWPSLQSLVIIDCVKVDVLSFGMERSGSIEVNNAIQKPVFFYMETVEFPSLRRIEISSLPNLKKISPSSILTRIAPNLTELIIDDCNMLEAIFDGIQRSSSVEEICNEIRASPLSSLTLSRLPKLKHVWNMDTQGTLVFQNLQKINIYDCPNLESVFPPFLAKGLFQLETLMIENCDLLREIVAKEEVGKKTETYMPQFVFPKLKSLRLEKLPELVSFYPGLHTSEWPSLQSLLIVDCVKVDVLSFGMERSGSIEVNNAIQKPLFVYMETDIFENLEELAICRRGYVKSLVPSSVCLHNLTSLVVSECHGMVNLATAKSLGHVLRRMSISNCQDMIEIIAGDVIETQGEFVFSKLETLELHNLPCLTSFYSGNRIMKFPNLTTVIVSECHEMQSFCIHGAITRNLNKIITTIDISDDMFDYRWSIDEHFDSIQRRFKTELWDGDINTTLQELWRIAHPLTSEEEDSEQNSKEDLESDSNLEETSTEDSEKDGKKDHKEDYGEQFDSKNDSEEDSSSSTEEGSKKSSEKDMTESVSENDFEEDYEKHSMDDFEVSSSEKKCKV